METLKEFLEHACFSTGIGVLIAGIILIIDEIK